MSGRARLSDEAIQERLAGLPGWERERGVLVRAFRFPAFLEGIEFVRRVALEAEARDHHPDLDIRWRTVRCALTTHSAGGLTALDFDLAAAIDRLAAE